VRINPAKISRQPYTDRVRYIQTFAPASTATDKPHINSRCRACCIPAENSTVAHQRARESNSRPGHLNNFFTRFLQLWRRCIRTWRQMCESADARRAPMPQQRDIHPPAAVRQRAAIVTPEHSANRTNSRKIALRRYGKPCRRSHLPQATPIAVPSETFWQCP